MLTISRSVDRVFQVIQLFTERRRPLSAADVRHALNLPHSSTISLLSRLVTLGYLDQNPETRRFYPSLRLHHLFDMLPKAVFRGNRFAMLADAVQSKLHETTSISRLNDVFTLPIYSQAAAHVDAVRVIPGLNGGLATQSVVGRTLLSMLPDTKISSLIERAAFWAQRAGVEASQDRDQIMRNVKFTREHGYLCGNNSLQADVGAVSCPLPWAYEGEQLVISVAGKAERIQRDGQHISNTLLREVASFCSRHAEPPPGEAGHIAH
jgi:IclR family pca regulon transcriptional regulator